MNIFISAVSVIVLLIILNFFTGYMNSRVRMIKKREKKFDEFEQQGYKLTKRWHCNYMSIAIDEKKKIIACIVLGLKAQFYVFNINEIVGKPEVKTSGVISKLVTSVAVVFKSKDNNYYLLRTLTIKKGFGVLKSGNIFKKAVADAEEILKTIEKCR